MFHFSAHDTNLVRSVSSQLAATTIETTDNVPHPHASPRHPIISPSSRKFPYHHGGCGDSIVLPNITDDNLSAFTKSGMIQLHRKPIATYDDVITKAKQQRKKRGKTRQLSGTAQFVTDYRPGRRPSMSRRVDDDDHDDSAAGVAKSYWWRDDMSMPFVGGKYVGLTTGHARDGTTSRSSDSVLVSKKSHAQMSRKGVGSMPNGRREVVPELVQDVLNSRSKMAAKQTIQYLMNLFVADEAITPRSDDSLGVETYGAIDGGRASWEFTSGRRHGMGMSIGGRGGASSVEIMNDLSKHSKLDLDRMSYPQIGKTLPKRAVKQQHGKSAKRHYKIATSTRTRRVLPLSEDTVLLGAPYRTEDEHRETLSQTFKKSGLLN